MLNFDLFESFLNDLGKINEIVSANSQHFFINWIANDDWRPKGGLPIIWIFLYDSVILSTSNNKKSCFVISLFYGIKS